MNFTSNAASLAVFVIDGKAHLGESSNGGGQLLGAQLGARMVVTRGAKFIGDFSSSSRWPSASACSSPPFLAKTATA
jgi:hypothetical protein